MCSSDLIGFVFSQFQEEILKVKAPYNVNAMTARVAINLFENMTPEIFENRKKQNEKAREEMKKKLIASSFGFRCFASEANFVFCAIEHGFYLSDLQNALLLCYYPIQLKHLELTGGTFVRVTVPSF